MKYVPYKKRKQTKNRDTKKDEKKKDKKDNLEDDLKKLLERAKKRKKKTEEKGNEEKGNKEKGKPENNGYQTPFEQIVGFKKKASNSSAQQPDAQPIIGYRKEDKEAFFAFIHAGGDEQNVEFGPVPEIRGNRGNFRAVQEEQMLKDREAKASGLAAKASGLPPLHTYKKR
jgi:hypothetical protein